MSMVDDQFQACVATIKGTLVSPRTPSWIDTQTGKGARLDHLVGLGVEFTCATGRAAWVGSPFQDHARVSFAVKIGTPKVKDTNIDKKEWHQTMTLKQWQGISHLMDCLCYTCRYHAPSFKVSISCPILKSLKALHGPIFQRLIN